ncbi:MAG: SsrA-binding protein, partial [Pseudomonadota bacterium]|nr:SsrA-binding protein [Pseudomonadota bacterium]
WLHNAHIAEYMQAGKHLQHDPKRDRKLLLHRREINKLIGSITRSGYTVVPLRVFFDKRGLAKIEIALAKGKKDFDKRETEKKRDWDRQKGRILRDKA